VDIDYPDSKVFDVNQLIEQQKEKFFILVPRKQKILGTKFMLMFQERLDDLATMDGLTMESTRVLLHLLAKMDFENWIVVKQVNVAEHLGMHRPHVTRAFKRLTDLGIIEKVKHDGITAYRLNPSYGWKGKASTLKKRVDLDDYRE
jgi:predicted transcriptional regulator